MEHLEESTSRQLGYVVGFVTIVQFGKKTANIKCKKTSQFTILCKGNYTSHIQNSTNHFTSIS